LHQPLAIFEKIRLVVGVEFVPPLLGLVVETFLIEIRDLVVALEDRLLCDEFGVLRIDFYVVPGVVCENVVAFFQETGAELERIGAFLRVVLRVCCGFAAGTPYASSFFADGVGSSIATYFRKCSMPLVNWFLGAFDLTGRVVSFCASSAILTR
jgi:hypothetical protein